MSATTTAAVATAVIVTAGRFSQGKPIDVGIAIGAGAFAIGLSLISAADEKIARQFAFMVLFLAMVLYLPSIVEKLGWRVGPAYAATNNTRTRAPGTPTRAAGAPGVGGVR